MPDETTLESRVPPNHAGSSLLDYLSTRFRYQAREAWEGLVLSGKIRVNGQKAEPSLILKKGDRVAYSVVLQEPPVDRDIRVLHEEETFLVASKPGRLPSHADGNFIKNTFIYKLYGRTDAEFLDFVRRAKAGNALNWKSPEGAARQLLHASRLTFAHPLTGKALDFSAEMPGDMREFIKSGKLIVFS